MLCRVSLLRQLTRKGLLVKGDMESINRNERRSYPPPGVIAHSYGYHYATHVLRQLLFILFNTGSSFQQGIPLSHPLPRVPLSPGAPNRNVADAVVVDIVPSTSATAVEVQPLFFWGGAPRFRSSILNAH